MHQLPAHGCISCRQCYLPDESERKGEGWRITNDPRAWGSSNPVVLVLGFSKGPRQARAPADTPHDAIACKGWRINVAKIFHHIGLIEEPNSSIIDEIVSDKNGQFHFGSLIRCSVERYDEDEDRWCGTGGGMLDGYLATRDGRTVAINCASTFIRDLPPRTRLVVMMGMGRKGGYIAKSRRIFEQARPGPWHAVNEVAYADSQVVVVHTAHFACQGNLISGWLGERDHKHERLGRLAREAVEFALSC